MKSKRPTQELQRSAAGSCKIVRLKEGAYLLLLLCGALALLCEPRAHADAQPQNLVTRTEVQSARDANTRLWENVYRQPQTDPLTKLPTGEMIEVRESFFEKGTGICYDARELPTTAGLPQWMPTDTRIEAANLPGYGWQVIKSPVRVFFRAALTGADGPNISLQPRGGSRCDTQILGLIYQDPASGRTQLIDLPRPVAAQPNGNRLLYKGAFACGSLEYIVKPTGVEQDLIVEDPASLPDPASLGFDPQTVRLMVGTCLSALDSGLKARVINPASKEILSEDIRKADLSVVNERRKQGRNLSLEFRPDFVPSASFTFQPGMGFDGSHPRAKVGQAPLAMLDAPAPQPQVELHKVIERINTEGDINMLEGIELSWVQDPKRQLPIRIDYDYIANPPAIQNEAWAKGLTYYISSQYVIYNGNKLVIEPGAIVKAGYCDGEPAILAQWTSQFTCKGNPYDSIHIVPAHTNIGAFVTAAVVRPNYLLYLQGGSGMETIEYVKFGGAYAAICLYSDALITRSAEQGPHIAHCVFNDSSFGVHTNVNSYNSTLGSEISIFNCLFVNNYYAGIRMHDIPWFANLIEIANCTFKGGQGFFNWAPIYITSGDSAGPQAHIANNILITETNTPCIMATGFSGSGRTGYIANNAYYTPSGSFQSGLGVYATVSPNTNLGSSAMFRLEEDNFIAGGFANGSYYGAGFMPVDPDTDLVFDIAAKGLPKNSDTIDCIIDAGNSFSSYGSAVPNANIDSTQAATLANLTVVRPIRVADWQDARFNINLYAGNNESESSKIRHKPTIDACFLDSATSVDLGYHYPVVHGVIANEEVSFEGYDSSDRTLNLHPGTVIASLGEQSHVRLTPASGHTDLGCIAIGTPAKPIRFLDYAACGDSPSSSPAILNNPSGSAADRYLEIDVRAARGESLILKYCSFEHARTAINITGPAGEDFFSTATRAQVSDCIFRYNGLWETNDTYLPGGIALSHCDADIMNCLFHFNRAGIAIDNHNSNGHKTQFQPNIIGCTFSRCMNGVVIAPGFYLSGYYSDTSYEDHTYGLIEDCIFASNFAPNLLDQSGAIRLYQYAGGSHAENHFTGILRRNHLWNSPKWLHAPSMDITNYALYSNAWTNHPDGNTTVALNPRLVNYSTMAGSAWRDDEAASRQFFLAQAEGDASREPLITGRVTGASFSGGLSASQINLYVFGAPGLCGGSAFAVPSPLLPTISEAHCKFQSIAGSQSVGQNTTVTYALVAVQAANGDVSVSASHAITLEFRSGQADTGGKSSVTFRLPTGTLNAYHALWLWLAQDGSIYWANSTPGQQAGSAINQDIFYALHHGAGALARPACDGTAATRSPAVDAGTPDYLSGGWTSTELRYDVVNGTVSRADHILPREWRQGYIRTGAYGYGGGSGERSAEAAEMAKKLDLGYHYGGQEQDWAPRSSPSSGNAAYTTLAPAIRVAPLLPPWSHSTISSVPVWQDDARFYYDPHSGWPKTRPRLSACAYTAPGIFDGRATGATVFAQKQTRTSLGFISTLFALDADTVQWQPVLTPEMMLRTSINGYEYGQVCSIDSIAVPADCGSAAGTKLVAAQVLYTEVNLGDPGITSCTSTRIYLFERDANGNWVSAPGFGVVDRSWSVLENSAAVDPYMFTGSVAMAADRTGLVRIFWTEWTGDPGGGAWNQYQVIKHIWYNPVNNTRQANPDSIPSYNALSYRPLIDIHYGRALAAAMDDNIHQDGRIRVTWPQIIEGDSAATVKQGWFDPNQNTFQDRAAIAPELPLANFKYRNTAITVADINNASDFLDWLKSAALNMSFKAGAGGLAGWLDGWGSGAFYTRRGERVGGNDIWDAWIGSPDGATAPTQRVSPVAVAARGSRNLREAALELMATYWGGEGRITDYGSYSLSADGITQLRNGENPVLEANTGGFLDQVLAAHPYSLTMWEEGSIGSEQYYTSGTIFVVTPVRP